LACPFRRRQWGAEFSLPRRTKGGVGGVPKILPQVTRGAGVSLPGVWGCPPIFSISNTGVKTEPGGSKIGDQNLMALLEVDKIETYYGNIRALNGVSLTVNEGEVVTLIGSNGAGKTTTLRTISGLIRPRRGQIRLNGQPLDKVPADKMVRMGVAHSPEGRRIFNRMTVQENLEMGAFSRKDRTGISTDLEHVLTTFPRLRERLSQKGGTLSGGEQQMLAIGRALMSKPKILLLDEPSMGLSPILVETIFQIIRDINKQGTTILLVEQNALLALQVANRGYVIQTGTILMEDTGQNLLKSELVRKAYLGEE
jgi:branched-chain amino acid transport system ATP-binding protein